MINSLLKERYRIDSELGRGGMGVIYRARDTLLKRDVAVKVMSESGLGTEGRARLLSEAQAAAQLNHANIVTVFDAGEEDSTPFIVMELIEGESLHTQRPEEVEKIIAIAQQVCDALEHAHANDVIHRDLKPENVLLTPDSTIKLTDFGLARSIASRISAERMIVGTVFYIAPELALGKPYDGRADLYSLGVMLYELITGRLPFTADDPLAVISQHLHAPVVPPHTHRPDIPRALEAIILKLLAKNPDHRFSTALEVALALKQVSVTEEPTAPQAVHEVPDTITLLEQLARGRIIGRQKDLNQLRELWRHTQNGNGHLALISGEPGVGKTRLANEVMVYAQLSGAVVLKGGCYEYEATTPYVPLIAALREWVHVQKPDELRQNLSSMATELAKLAPEIETKLGSLEPNPPLPPNEERLRLFDSIARFLQRLGSERGLLLFLDDLHWADQGTLTLLHYLLRNMRSDPLLVVAAYREVELDRSHPLAGALVEWNRERLATRISLDRLTSDETCSLLCSIFGAESISDELVDAIYGETDGNPFFIEEVVKALIEQGQIYREGDHWGREEIIELAIPQSVKEAIGRRLNRLSEACINTLHTASVLGKSFAYNELEKVSSLNEDELLNALDEAVVIQLIRSESGESFIFTHDNIREVLYEELNPIRRRRLHQRIGESMEKLYASDLEEYFQGLAHHFIQSGDLPKGLRYSIQAAEKAERIYAHDEALIYYERAAESAESLELPEKLAEIYESMGNVYYLHGPFQKAVEYFQLALTLTPHPEKSAELKTRIGSAYAYVGDESGLEYLQAALEELDPENQQSELAIATSALGRFHHYRGQVDQAIDYLERALQLAEPLDDAATLTMIYSYLSGAYEQNITRQYLERSVEWARRCIALGERKNYPHAVAIGYEFLAENAFTVGRWQESLDHSAQSREIGEKIGSQSRVAWAEANRAGAYHNQGDLTAALSAGQNAQEIAERIGDNRLVVWVRARQARVEIDLGEDEMADADVDFILARANETEQAQLHGWVYGALAYLHMQLEEWGQLLECADKFAELVGSPPLSWYAEAYLGLGRLDDFDRLAAEAAAVEYDSQPLQYQADRWRLQGKVSSMQGSNDGALEFLDKAVGAFEELSSLLELGRTLYLRGKLHRAMGEPNKARVDLTRALEIFESCSAKRDAAKASLALEKLEPVT